MDEEIWKDIKNYEGYYKVSNFGRIKSLDRYIATSGNPSGQRLIRGKIKKQTRRKMRGELGYCFVNLSKNNVDKLHTVHKLVAEAFIPNPNNFPCINHKDEDKNNNRADNLEWCTTKYNNSYGTARERAASKTGMPVVKLDSNNNVLKRYDSLTIAAKEEGISKGNLSNVCVGRNGKLTLKGHSFMYEKDYKDMFDSIDLGLDMI